MRICIRVYIHTYIHIHTFPYSVRNREKPRGSVTFAGAIMQLSLRKADDPVLWLERRSVSSYLPFPSSFFFSFQKRSTVRDSRSGETLGKCFSSFPESVEINMRRKTSVARVESALISSRVRARLRACVRACVCCVYVCMCALSRLPSILRATLRDTLSSLRSVCSVCLRYENFPIAHVAGNRSDSIGARLDEWRRNL